MWSVSYSNWTGILASAFDDGSILCLICPSHTECLPSHNVPSYARVEFSLNLSKSFVYENNPVTTSLSSGSMVSTKCMVPAPHNSAIHDIILGFGQPTSAQGIRNNPVVNKLANEQATSLQAMTRIRWCRSSQTPFWLAYGGRAGLVILRNVQREATHTLASHFERNKKRATAAAENT